MEITLLFYFETINLKLFFVMPIFKMQSLKKLSCSSNNLDSICIWNFCNVNISKFKLLWQT